MPGKEIKGRSKIANYRHGGRIGFKKGGFSIKTKKVKPGFDQEFTLQKGVSAAPIKQSKVKGKGLGSGIKPSEAKDILKSPGKSWGKSRAEYLRKWSPHFGGRNLKKEMKAATKKSKK